MEAAIIRLVILAAVMSTWALARSFRKRSQPAPPSDSTTLDSRMRKAAANAQDVGSKSAAATKVVSPTGNTRHDGTGHGRKVANMDVTRLTLNQIRGYLEQRGSRFDVEEDDGIIRTAFQMPAMVAHVVIAVTHEGQLIQLAVTQDLVVPEKWRVPMAETVVRANFGLTLGRFDFDMSTGRLAFHVGAPLTEAGISEQQFDTLMAASLQTANRYHRAFCRLVYGDDLSPAEVVAEVEMAEPGPP